MIQKDKMEKTKTLDRKIFLIQKIKIQKTLVIKTLLNYRIL